MWFVDLPEHDPDSNYLRPSSKQLMYADRARDLANDLRRTLERMTVPHQRTTLNEIGTPLVGGVYRRTVLRVHPDGSSSHGLMREVKHSREFVSRGRGTRWRRADAVLATRLPLLAG